MVECSEQAREDFESFFSKGINSIMVIPNQGFFSISICFAVYSFKSASLPKKKKILPTDILKSLKTTIRVCLPPRHWSLFGDLKPFFPYDLNAAWVATDDAVCWL